MNARRLRRVRMGVSALFAVAACGWLISHVDVRSPGEIDRSAVVDEYCTDCHNTIDFDGGMAFVVEGSAVRIRTAVDEPEPAIWERAVRKVRAGMMPPAGAARPAAAVLAGLARSIETERDAAWGTHPDAGREPLSRLNRTEYVNSIRDLLAFDARAVVDSLPADTVVAGFDNIGDGLTVSPTLIEAYVAAAQKIARGAVGDRTAVAGQVRYEAPRGLDQTRHVDGLPLGTRGGFAFSHTFPLDATYELRIAGARPPGIATQSLCPPPAISLAIDGELIDVGDSGSIRLTLAAGPHAIAVALVDETRCAGVNELYDVYAARGGIRYVEIHGPFDATGPGDTPSRRAIFSCYPASVDQELSCAHEILAKLVSKAYRRPVADDDRAMETVLEFYAARRGEADFEAGIEAGIARILMSPRFIFQFEHEPDGLAPGTPYRLDDFEIATRLSFFLWSSLPDGELLVLASRGRLGDPDVMSGQVRRMLADGKAAALTENFASQWLGLRELREALPQDPAFDANLRDALAAETELLFADVVNENRSVLHLLDADYAYLNDRLADHYGIGGVAGSYMRRVPLPPDSHRRGILGQGSWLTATSVADRTSPVIRGEWFITNLLGAPVPQPPPGVEADLSNEAAIARPDDTLRERLERHRANPTCAACHRIMDPIGLAFENFDLIGRWRDSDNGKPIDTSATLVDGTEVEGPDDLAAMLRSKSDLFVTTLTEKLLTYALGRVVDHRDMPAVRRIVSRAADQDYRFESIVTGIVLSVPFQMRMSSAENSTRLAGTDSTSVGADRE